MKEQLQILRKELSTTVQKQLDETIKHIEQKIDKIEKQINAM